jgi:predicted site-specific integrase-resolvase
MTLMVKPSDVLLSPAEAAERLGISTDAMLKLMLERDIPTVKDSHGLWAVRSADIESFGRAATGP